MLLNIKQIHTIQQIYTNKLKTLKIPSSFLNSNLRAPAHIQTYQKQNQNSQHIIQNSQTTKNQIKHYYFFFFNFYPITAQKQINKLFIIQPHKFSHKNKSMVIFLKCTYLQEQIRLNQSDKILLCKQQNSFICKFLNFKANQYNIYAIQKVSQNHRQLVQNSSIYQHNKIEAKKRDTRKFKHLLAKQNRSKKK
eukprot:TRINITY_DN4424_c0_g1_i13.p1 TRINITY_DN4424_c0_g1~~TRINITY_DN4424_c0_g1_i13.p1  ORF type:complete len:193 (+),score=-18.29 TRINITY_DN4424_c0_g1_i13:150-728(+)